MSDARRERKAQLLLIKTNVGHFVGTYIEANVVRDEVGSVF